MQNPCYIAPDHATIALLKGAIGLDVPMSLMGIALSAFPEEHPGIPISLLRYVFGPLIVHVASNDERHNLGWLGQDAAKKWRPRVDLERIEILTGERPDIVSPAELWLVMYNAMHTAPMHHDITQIYLWAGQRAYVASGRTVPDALYKERSWRDLQPTDEAVFDGPLTYEYREMCRAIIRKVVQHSIIGRKTRVKRESVSPT